MINTCKFLDFEERYKDIGRQVCKVLVNLESFLEGDSYEDTRENNIDGICFLSRTVSRA